MEKADSCIQPGLSNTHLDPVEAATNRKMHDSLRQLAQGHLQAVSNTDLHRNPTQQDPKPTQLMLDFRPHQSSTQLAT